MDRMVRSIVLYISIVSMISGFYIGMSNNATYMSTYRVIPIAHRLIHSSNKLFYMIDNGFIEKLVIIPVYHGVKTEEKEIVMEENECSTDRYDELSASNRGLVIIATLSTH